MEALSFEEAFEQLEVAVIALQDGKMSLESALQHFEQGMKLAQHCHELLQKAELRVQLLRINNESVLEVQPFELP